MLQHQEELEDKGAPQESRKDVVEGAVDEQLASDPQKESVPSPGENPKGHLEGPLQQEEELEDNEAPQKSQRDIEERAVDEPLDSDPRKEFESSPRENSSVHIKVLLQQQEELEDKEPPQKNQKDVVGGAVDVPSPRENPKGHLKVLQPEQEQETEEVPQGSTTARPEGAAGEPLSHDAKGQFLPLPGEKRGHLEVIVNVVPSVYSPDRCEPVTGSPKSQRPESPDQHLQEDSCYLREDEDLLEDCGASMGYFSFYHTSSHLRPYRAKGGDSSRSGKPLQPQSSGEVRANPV
uniref:Uncharacterized protein n=1 Tax=Sphaerodactylus townsendi TaxID=933632 RepID=A0ACB8ET66_9SAUR